MSDQLKPTLPESLQRLLPLCSGCLCDFLASVSLRQFSCGHFYCPVCVNKTKTANDLYQCIFEKKTCDETELGQEIKPGEVLPTLLSASPPVTTMDDLKPFFGQIDLRKVPCKALVHGGVCRWAADCPYSHYPEHRDLVLKFQIGEDESCWECRDCRLTISRRLQHCPVCETPQPESRVVTVTGVKGTTSPRVDQTFQTEEDKPPGSPVGSPLRFRLDTNGEGDLMEQRSACCILQ